MNTIFYKWVNRLSWKLAQMIHSQVKGMKQSTSGQDVRSQGNTNRRAKFVFCVFYCFCSIVISVFLLCCVFCHFSLANKPLKIWRPGIGIILDFLESNRFSSSALFLLLHLCLQDLERLCSVELRLLFNSWSWHCFYKIYPAYFMSCICCISV